MCFTFHVVKKQIDKQWVFVPNIMQGSVCKNKDKSFLFIVPNDSDNILHLATSIYVLLNMERVCVHILCEEQKRTQWCVSTFSS